MVNRQGMRMEAYQRTMNTTAIYMSCIYIKPVLAYMPRLFHDLLKITLGIERAGSWVDVEIAVKAEYRFQG
ncbi:hypothetical protein ACMFMG_005624 [Clarireedia jacksonii]